MRYTVVARWPDGFETTVHDRGKTFTCKQAEALVRAAQKLEAYADARVFVEVPSDEEDQ